MFSMFKYDLLSLFEMCITSTICCISLYLDVFLLFLYYTLVTRTLPGRGENLVAKMAERTERLQVRGSIRTSANQMLVGVKTLCCGSMRDFTRFQDPLHVPVFRRR